MSGSGRKRSSKWDLIDDPEFAQGRGSNKDDIMSKDYGVLDATMEWDVDENYGRRISPGFDERQHRRSSRSPKNGWSRPVRSSRSRSPPHGLRRDSGVNDRNRARAGGSTQPCREFAAGKCRRGDHCHFLHDNQNHEDSWESKHREDAAPRYSAPNESRDHSLKGGKSNEACYNFAKGRCRMGASCKFVHENYVAYGKPSLDELTRERETDRRPRDSSFEKGGGHGPSRSSDTPCKFFASGNCRNGKYCRFSHDRQTCRSPNRRSRDDGWAGNQGGDYQTPARPKLSGFVSPNRRLRDDRWGSDLNMADADKVWDSPKGIDTVSVSDTAKMVEEKGENVGAKEPRPAWPTRDGWGHGLDKSSVHAETPFLSDTKEGDRGHNLDPFFCDKKEADRGHSFDKSRVHGETPFLTDKKEADRDMAENTSTKMHSSQSIGTEVWSGDAEMSPDWNYRVGSSSHIEEKHGQSKHGITQGGTGRYLATSEHDGIQVASGQGFCENVHNVNPLHSSGPRAEGKSQVAVPILPSRGGIVAGMQIQEVSTEKKYNVEPNIMDADLSQVSSRNPPTQNAVSKEKLAEINNLSASLAHFLGAGQQLPQLYAALNSHDAKDTPFLAKSEVPAMRISNTFIKEDPAVGLPKQCDPMCDSIEPKNGDASGVPQAIPPRKKAAEGEVEIPSQLSNLGRQNGGATFKAACSEELVKSGHSIQLQSGQNPKVNKDNTEVEAGERQNSQDDNKNTKEIRPSKNMDQNGGPDESNKTKDMKGNRAFKFALVEFVKELLKQPWKEGRITKEDYKTIVKKVVDKVTGTMQGANIPQTQEKIDHYLSFSKPKLNKLVQAYVEKVHKP